MVTSDRLKEYCNRPLEGLRLDQGDRLQSHRVGVSRIDSTAIVAAIPFFYTGIHAHRSACSRTRVYASTSRTRFNAKRVVLRCAVLGAQSVLRTDVLCAFS